MAELPMPDLWAGWAARPAPMPGVPWKKPLRTRIAVICAKPPNRPCDSSDRNAMDTFFDEIKGGIADSDMLIRIVMRLVLATAFGSLIGWERRRSGHFAGLRTHMLVC